MGVIKYKIEVENKRKKMPAPLRVQLNRQEEETLTELRQAISIPYRTRGSS
jgi:hypothetical protein